MAVAGAAVFVWLGMVLAVSFLEAPLKFRAPGVTTAIGVGIGRLVFRALNLAEAVLAAVALVALAVTRGPLVLPVVPAALLLIQVVAVRPALSRRADAVLAGTDGPRSRAHLVYVAFEVLKVAALLVAGGLLLTGPS